MDMTRVKINQQKSNQPQEGQIDLIDLELVKSEPDDVIHPTITTVVVQKTLPGTDAVNQDPTYPIVIAPQTSPRAFGKSVAPIAISAVPVTTMQQTTYTVSCSNTQPSKTFLLFNNRSGGVQSMLLSGSSATRKSTFVEPSQMKVRTSSGLQTVVTAAGPRSSSFIVGPHHRPADSLSIPGGTVITLKTGLPQSLVQSRPCSTPTDITFVSRSIDPDGTVKTIKEFLCNFCQYKVAGQAEFEAHRATHTFSCNHCYFKAFSRFEVLRHKKERHPACAEELAGYAELDKMIEEANAASFQGLPTSPAPQQVILSIPAPTQQPVSNVTTIVARQAVSPDPPQLELQSVLNSDLQNVAASFGARGPQEERNAVVCTPIDAPKSVSEDTQKNKLESKELKKVSDATKTPTSTSEASRNGQTSSSDPGRGRPSRPRRAVAERKQTLKEVDSDSQAEADNKSDDDDWEEKLPKSLTRKKARKDVSSTKVVTNVQIGKPIEIIKVFSQNSTQVSQQPSSINQGLGQKISCPFCSYETTDTNALSYHTRNCEHRFAKKNFEQALLAGSTPTSVGNKSLGAARESSSVATTPKEANSPTFSTVHWSCFYCNVTSTSQATVVGHVMKSHPGKPLQLKRISIPKSASAFLNQLQQPKAVNQSLPVQVGENPSQAATSSISSSKVFPTQEGVASTATPDVAVHTNKASNVKTVKSNNDTDGCLWGCYYCPIQSIDRNEIINHLKKEHPELKLVVTRRRITHVPAAVKVSTTGESSGDKNISNPVDGKRNQNSPVTPAGGSDKPENDASAVDDEKMEESKKRGTKRKSQGQGSKKKKSLVSVSSEPRVLRSRKVSPGSISPSLRDISPGQKSQNDPESPVISSKRRRIKQDDQLSGSGKVPFSVAADVNEGQKSVENDPSGALATIVKKIHDYPKPAKSSLESQRWKCAYCDFKAVLKSKTVSHVSHCHSELPVKFVFTGKSHCRQYDGCSRLRGPRSVKEMNLLKNGNWLWQCPICDRKHVSKGYLNVHLKVAHPKKRFSGPPLAPIRKSKSAFNDERCRECSVSLVLAEEMVHYDSLSSILLDNGLSLVKALDIDDDLECDVARHRKYKCSQCVMRGFRPMVVKKHFLESHFERSVSIVDLKLQKGENITSEKQHMLYSCLKSDCNFLTKSKDVLESHYASFADHSKLRSGTGRKKSLNNSELGSCADDSDVTLDADSENDSGNDDDEDSYKSFKLPVRGKPNDTGLQHADTSVPGTEALSNRHHANTFIANTSQSSAAAASTSSDNQQRNSLKTISLSAPKSSDIASGLSMLKKTLNASQAMSDMRKLNKSNGADELSSNIATDAVKTSQTPLISSTSESGTGENQINNTSITAAQKSSSTSSNRQNSMAECGKNPAARSSKKSRSTSNRQLESKETNEFGHFKYTTDGKLIKRKKSTALQKAVLRYLCAVCNNGFVQISQVKQHMITSHAPVLKDKAFCIDAHAKELRKRQKILFCLSESCAYCFKSEHDLTAHLATPGECPMTVDKMKSFDAGEDGDACEPSTAELPEKSVTGNIGDAVDKSQLVEEGLYWKKTYPKLNKSYQCSYCTFTTLDVTCIKSHVVTQHKQDLDGHSSVPARRAGFSEIATEMTSDGNFVTSVNDREVDGKGGEENCQKSDKSVLKDVCGFNANLETVNSGNEPPSNPVSVVQSGTGVGGKVYTVL